VQATSEATSQVITSSAVQPRVAASRRQVAAVVVGNTLEVYDFLIYAYFAVHIGRTFFPSEDPTTSLLASLATFGAGFITRPLGALVIGRLADRVGRKPAMVLSFGLMGVAILGLALTPSYNAIGIAAPCIVIVFRLLQGFALGGELGPSTTYLLEAAPPHRRGLYVSFQYVGQSCATLIAGLMGVLLATFMGEAALETTGWRIAMLTGALIIPVGLLLRRSLAETLHLQEPAHLQPAVGPSQASRLRIAVLALVMLSAGTTVTYVFKYLTTYAIATLHMPARVAFAAPVIGGLVSLCISPLGGALSDRIGRKPLMTWPWVCLLVGILPGFYAIAHYRTPAVLFTVSAVLIMCGAFAASSILTAITESLPKHVRSATLSLVYAVAISIFGGSAQFNVAWLTRALGTEMAPAWYLAIAVAFGLIAIVAMPETAPAKLAKSSARAGIPG
jgi:MFS family permease